MSELNILQTTNQLGIGGTEKALETFVRNMDRDVFDVCVSCRRIGERGINLARDGFEVFVTSDEGELVEFIKRKRIQVVHIHRSGIEEAFYINAAKKAGVPVVVETNVFGLLDNSESGRMIDCHIFVSKTCATRYMKTAKTTSYEFHNKCRVLYNPIDFDLVQRFEPTGREIGQLKDELGIEDDERIIAKIGRPDLRKWSDLIVEAFEILLRKYGKIKLVIGGCPSEKRESIANSRIGNNVIFIDNVSDQYLTKLYYLIDGYVHSSLIGESFGYTIAEAMAARKPVIADSNPTKDNAQIELIDNGVTGLIANTPRSFARAIRFVIENRDVATEMGINGHDKAKREFDAKRNTKILEKIYIDFLKGKDVGLDSRIVDDYRDITYHPSMSEIDVFLSEYSMRLFDCFGKPKTFESCLELSCLKSNLPPRRAIEMYNHIIDKVKMSP